MRILYFLAALLIIAIFSLPYVASTQWGNSKLTALVNSRIEGSVKAKAITLSWLGPQIAENITVRDPNGNEILEAALISLDSNLFNLLLKRIPNQIILTDLNARLQNANTSLEVKAVNGFVKLGTRDLPVSVRLKGNTQQDGIVGNFDLEAELSTTDMQNLLNVSQRGFDFQKDRIKLKANVVDFPVDLLDALLTYQKPELKGALSLLLGKKLNFIIEQTPTIEGINLSLQANSPSAELEILTKFDGQQISLIQPGKANFVISPELTEKICPNFSLKAPVRADLSISQLTLPIMNTLKANTLALDIAGLSLLADLHMPYIELQNSLAARDLHLLFDTNPNKNSVDVSLRGEALQNGQPVGIKVAGKLDSNPLMTKKLAGTLEIEELMFSNHLPFLQKIRAVWEADAKTNSITFDFGGIAKMEKKDAEGEFAGHLIITQWIQSDIIDFSHANLDLKTNFNQFPVALLHLFLGSHNLQPLLGETVDLTLKGSANMSQIDQAVADIYLHSALLQGKAALNMDKISFELLSNDHKQGDFNITGSAEKVFTPEGKFDWNNYHLNVNATAQNLQSIVISKAAGLTQNQNNQLLALLGSEIDANIKLQLQKKSGPIYVDIKGINGKYLLDGRLERNTLLLNQPFTAEIKPTPDLGRYLLGEFIPLLSGMLEGENPIKAYINPQGFALPLSPLDAKSIRIPYAILDVGKIHFSNTGQLSKVVSVFAQQTSEHLSVWFTPLYFSYLDSVLKIERVDMLVAGQYPIAAWGTVNVATDKVKMIVALTGTALAKAFNVKVSNKDFMIQLPLKGTLSNASIDKGQATTRITALIAQSKGGPHGLILGTVLNIAGGGLKEEKVPSPTTNPLPWSDLLENEPEEPAPTEKKEKTAKIKDFNPSKEIQNEVQKGAESLIKKIFR